MLFFSNNITTPLVLKNTSRDKNVLCITLLYNLENDYLPFYNVIFYVYIYNRQLGKIRI